VFLPIRPANAPRPCAGRRQERARYRFPLAGNRQRAFSLAPAGSSFRRVPKRGGSEGTGEGQCEQEGRSVLTADCGGGSCLITHPIAVIIAKSTMQAAAARQAVPNMHRALAWPIAHWSSSATQRGRHAKERTNGWGCRTP
jgi:hypothetical protein